MVFEALSTLSYQEIQKLAVRAKVKAKGPKVEIIHRLLGLHQEPGNLRRSERIARPIPASKYQLGHAMKFNWPQETASDGQTRLLMQMEQVWTQLIEIKTRSSLLSTSETTQAVLTGHKGPVYELRISPHGGYTASYAGL
ncbi:hypothetical protein B0H21DRAFT_711468 [Amylocystis lapponica]|nr:hypothetical protein B0H21DRAFT_711468 [Amylocystis lapponica]